MGVCQYCGEDAGTFRSSHKECRAKRDIAKQKIPEFFVKALSTPVEPRRFCELATEVARSHYLDESELRGLVIKGMTEMIEQALEDKWLTAHEGNRINAIRAAFGINGTDKDFEVVAFKFKKAEILRELSEGRVPEGIDFAGFIPINFAKGEKLVWVSTGVTCFRTRTKTTYSGRSQGVSIRVMSGVSFRVGSFKGRPIKTQELVEAGRGDLILTNKHVYFSSAMQSLKIPPKRIVSIEPYSDGVALLRDNANALPIIFKLDDPWFIANAINRLNQLA